MICIIKLDNITYLGHIDPGKKGRFDPDKKVWINLLDGARFVGSFFTCSYMAGCSEWTSHLPTSCNDLYYIGRLDPDKKVLINLLDGGRFVVTLCTYSYMEGCSE